MKENKTLNEVPFEKNNIIESNNIIILIIILKVIINLNHYCYLSSPYKLCLVSNQAWKGNEIMKGEQCYYKLVNNSP